MVSESDGTSLSLTDVGTTENSISVNVTVMNTGRHNVTCVADNNGLTETNTTQFYGISKLCSKYSYMYMKVWIVHVLALVCAMFPARFLTGKSLKNGRIIDV